MDPNIETENMKQSVQESDGHATAAHSSVMSQFMANVSTAILKDPGLPRPNPTISAWQIPVHPTVSSIQSTALPEFTDFVVIGSGITGCSVTKTLLEHGAAKGSHVTVLEARTLVSGATGRNGGHLVTAAGHTFGPLAQQHGLEAAKQITRFSVLNIQHVMDMVKAMDKEVQENCQIRDVRKVMAVGDDETWAAARNSVLAFQKNVPECSTYHRIVEAEDVPERWNIKGASGAVEHDAGAIWPYRLLTGIYERLLARYPDRLAIETHTPVTQVKFLHDTDSDYPYLVKTPRGAIKAKKVIHCTNGHASHLLPQLAGRIYPFRGTMSVHKPGPQLENVGASKSWSLSHKPTLDARTGLFDTGLYYLQQNALTGRIWIGNETAYMRDILTADDTYVPERAVQALSTVLPKFFLKGWGTEYTSEIESIWSGIQGHTADGLPIVGQAPACVTGSAHDNGQWIAAGFNGYGMDKCWLTGEALVKMMLGEDVSGWFPQCYLLTEDRLQNQLTAEATVNKFAGLASEPLEAKL
ncbi:FAD dependent oxidoreductase superfamily protein [Fusarium flagelliforme]|uniref:FAD dependent oxidoreductase superfamily protein n=1 Tax=Fusarium flagelliforme TaxID=2675880 RepID=A0A395N017_9HYPO|nr:FAD dependent oxidoreductase superfamily protein [Fusarium flagelliforme]